MPTGFVETAFKYHNRLWGASSPDIVDKIKGYNDQTAICGELLGRYSSRVLLIDHRAQIFAVELTRPFPCLAEGRKLEATLPFQPF